MSFFQLPESPLVGVDDNWTLWALMAGGTALSLWLETRYRWAERLSAPVVGMLLAMVLSNVRIMPTDAPAYDFIGAWLVPLALPLLLMQANVVRIAKETGRLFAAVHLSAIGTVIGAFAAMALLHDHLLEGNKAAAIMTASYIGGMVNYLAVFNAVGASPDLSSALTLSDNLVMAGTFLLMIWMAGSRWFLTRYPHPHTADDGTGLEPAISDVPEEKAAPATVVSLGAALAVAFGVVAIAMAISRETTSWFDPAGPGGYIRDTFRAFFAESSTAVREMIKTLITNRFVLITLISLITATVFHRPLARLRAGEDLGRYLLYLFLFSIGLPADLQKVFGSSQIIYLFILCIIMAAGNILFTLAAGKLLKLNLENLILAMNATLGGPATAATMAASRGWSRLVIPGLLAGLWGYTIGTPLGLMVYSWLSNR